MFQKLSATSACACVGVWGSQVLTCERQLLAAHSRSPCSSSAPHICRALDGRRRPRLSSSDVRRTVGSSPSTQSTSPPRHRGYSPIADRTTLSGQPRAIASLQCSLAPLHPQPLPVILSTKKTYLDIGIDVAGPPVGIVISRLDALGRYCRKALV